MKKLLTASLVTLFIVFCFMASTHIIMDRIIKECDKTGKFVRQGYTLMPNISINCGVRSIEEKK